MLIFNKTSMISSNQTLCLSGDKIIELTDIKYYVNEIRNLVSASHEVYDTLYLQTLYRLAEFCQAMPFSDKHFNVPYGMLKRQLFLTVSVLKIRRGKLLPKNAATETISTEEAAWTYALFSASILNRIDSIQHDRKITLHRANSDPVGAWSPISGSLYEKGCYYRMEFINQESTIEKNILLAALSGRVIPPAAIRWLANYPALYSCWWKTILHENNDDHSLLDIIDEAEKKSGTSTDKIAPSVFENFTQWLMTKLKDNPTQLFQIKKGFFIHEALINDFISETSRFNKTSFLQELSNGNYLILNEDGFYHSLAPIKFEDRRVLNGIILNIDFLPEKLKNLPINNNFKDNISL